MIARARGVPALVVLAMALAAARPALAQSAPAEQKAGEASEARPEPPVAKKRPANVAGTTLAVTGVSLMGLGMGTLMASGITWIVASSDASRLDDECPGKRCVEGSDGADRLDRARDTERAADIVFGIGAPVLATGFVLVLMAAGLSRSGETRTIVAAPVAGPRGGGGVVSASF